MVNENVQTMNVAPINRAVITKVRHKAESKLYTICVIITALAVLLALIVSVSDLLEELDLITDEYLNEGEAAPVGGGVEEADDEDLTFFILVGAGIILVFMYLYYAYTRAYAIKVSEKNFPEIYNKSVEFARKLGLKKVPSVYIEQQNGILNAFAAAVLGKRYAMLNAEIVDVAYMEHKDFDTVYFVLAHEFGHIYFKHVTYLFNLLTFIPHLIPVFGPLHSRSMEYSCDRVAQLLMERDCVQESMILSAGRHLYKYVDVGDYLENAKKERGLFLWFVNMMASHPITIKRTQALADPTKKSGKLL